MLKETVVEKKDKFQIKSLDKIYKVYQNKVYKIN